MGQLGNVAHLWRKTICVRAYRTGFFYYWRKARAAWKHRIRTYLPALVTVNHGVANHLACPGVGGGPGQTQVKGLSRGDQGSQGGKRTERKFHVVRENRLSRSCRREVAQSDMVWCGVILQDANQGAFESFRKRTGRGREVGEWLRTKVGGDKACAALTSWMEGKERRTIEQHTSVEYK